MHLRLTVVDPVRYGRAVQVTVQAPPGAPLHRARPALLDALGPMHPSGPVAPVLYCDGRPLSGDEPLGVPPLTDGAVLSAGPDGVVPGSAAGTAGTALLELHVVGGPDAGRVVPLPPGRWEVGRGPRAAIRLVDPDCSRRHAELQVTGDGVRVRDAGSTNGTWLEHRPVPEQVRVGDRPLPVGPSGRIRLGGSVLAVRGPETPQAALTPDGAGHLLVNRAPRLAAPPPAASVRFPPPAPSRPPRALPWAAVLLPPLIVVPLSVLMRQPTFLMFALLSPMIMLAQHLFDRRGGRREARAARAEHEAAVAEAETRLATALAADLGRLEEDHPDLAVVAALARLPGSRLWERSRSTGDAIEVRLGTGEVPARVEVSRPEHEPPVRPGHPRAPLVLDLSAATVTGVAGPREAVIALARSIIGQVAALHSPQELRVGVIRDQAPAADATDAWAWVNWLPHRDGAPAAPVPGHRDPERGSVVLLDGVERLRRRPEVAGLLRRPDAHGAVLICLDSTVARLPVECTAVVEISDEGGATLRVRGHGPRPFRPDLPSAGWAERLGRAMAPLRDSTPQAAGGLPTEARLVDLITGEGPEAPVPDPRDPRALAGAWSRRGRSGRAVLGRSADGPWSVDLDRDGPHLLVGGTTGSGKSELLITLIASLAAANRPDELCFVLVDYKGGASFAECAELPHVGGLVTDLDPALARRALRSLTAELRRREAQLRVAGAPDVAGYLRARARGAATAPMPRLVIVVDEFRVLVEEHPEFVAGLVRVAAVGRSLGVHLVLATQRPAGVVSADIRANTNLRIALRVQDPADSTDVVDVADAAAIPSSAPGRALVRVGGAPVRQVQTARVRGVRTGPADEVRVVVTGSAAPGPATLEQCDARRTPEAEVGPDDLTRIVTAARDASALLGIPAAAGPWLPPLPDRVDLGDLPDSTWLDGPVLPFGLADLPDAQAQRVRTWAPVRDGHLAVIGGPRSGRTTTLCTLARAAGGAGLHVHAVDSSGGLAAVAALPWVGTVAPAGDAELCDRLLRRLSHQIELRRRRAATTGDARQPLPPEPPDLLLLVDDWESVVESWSAVDHGRPVDQLVRLVREGAGAGLHVAVAGGRALLSGAPASVLGRRLLLRTADPADLLLAGVRATEVPGRMPPGRALDLRDREAVEVQVAVGSASPAEDRPAASRDHARRATAHGGRPGIEEASGPAAPGPWRLEPLPPLVPLARLSAVDPGDGPGAGLVIGVGGDDVTPLRIPTDVAPGLLVCGAPGTGRTTALATIAVQLCGQGVTVLVLAGDPAAAGLRPAAAAGARVFGAGQGDALLAALARDRSAAVLLDDVVSRLAPAVEDALLRRLPPVAPVDGPGRGVVVACTPAEALSAFRGILPPVRSSGTGLFLGGPGPGEGEVFGVRLPSWAGGRPGRGALVVAGTVTPLQVAHPGRTGAGIAAARPDAA